MGALVCPFKKESNIYIIKTSIKVANQLNFIGLFGKKESITHKLIYRAEFICYFHILNYLQANNWHLS